MARGFVEKQHLGAPVESARDENPLLLPSRQDRAHVADKRSVGHGHGRDIIMHGGEAGALLDAKHIGIIGEERDVVGDRACEKLVVLHDDAHHGAIIVDAHAGDRRAVHEDLPFGRGQEPGDDFEKRRLAAAGGSGDRHRFTGGHPKADAVENPGLVLAVAEADILQLDADGVWRRDGCDRRAAALLRFGQGDVGQPFAMQPQHGQVDDLVDQVADPAEELILVADEGKEQPDGKAAVQHPSRTQPDDQDHDNPEDELIGRPEQDAEPLGGQLAVQRLDHQVEPVNPAIRLIQHSKIAKKTPPTLLRPRPPASYKCGLACCQPPTQHQYYSTS